MLDMCYASSAKTYREQMGGSADAVSLPPPTDEGVAKWEGVATSFDDMVHELEDALRAAEAAHEGRAADAANSSIAEITPIVEAAANTSRGVKAALQEQATCQREAFQSLPAKGDTLPSGQEAILDPPQKGWVEEWGLDSNPITGWMSDYEERQQAFIDTNQQANQAMERYKAQTEANIARMPEFQPADQPPPPQPKESTPYPSTPTSTGTPSGYTGSTGTPSTPATTSSSWASAPTPSYTPPPAPSAPPAATNPVWATPAFPGQNQGLPPGVVRGPDGTLYRQNPQTGAWERQNPYNGRWAPSPNGGPGGARGGMGAAGRAGGPGGQLGAGGRAGAGGLGGGVGSGTGASGSGAAGAAGRGAAGGMGGAGAAGRGKQGEEDQEHQRPGWLTEDDDVFTNDMEKVAPPVFGDWSNGGR
ncbi:hypothetical protein GCM10023108_43060 [Saccharopolyspora hordei]